MATQGDDVVAAVQEEGDDEGWTTGERMYRIRRRKKMSREAFAQFLQVSPRSVDRYERDELLPPSRVLVRLGVGWSISADWVLRLTEVPNLRIRWYDDDGSDQGIEAAQDLQRSIFPVLLSSSTP